MQMFGLEQLMVVSLGRVRVLKSFCRSFKFLAFPFFLLFLGLCDTALAAPEVPQWNLVQQEDGIDIYTRPEPVSTMVSFRLVFSQSMPIHTIASTLLDIPGYASWMSYLIQSRIIKRIAVDQFIAYQRFDFPWPFDDRDIVAEVTVKRDYKTGTLSAQIRALPDPLVPIDEDCVRITNMWGEFVVQYLSSSLTKIIYSESFDPGGNFTQWLAEYVSLHMPLVVVASMKKELREPSADRTQEANSIAREIEKQVLNGSLPP